MTWYLGWTPYAILHGLNPFHTTFIDFPTGANLASNTSSPLLGIISAPVSLALGPVAAFNVLLRLAFATSAGSMFLVLRTWCRRSTSFVGGLIYGFGPYVVGQASTHLNLAFIPLLPPIVWIVYELIGPREFRPRTLGLWLGVVVGLQFFIDPEPVALLAAVIIPSLLVFAVIERRRLRDRFSRLVMAAPFALSLIVAIDGVFIWWMLLGPDHVNGAPLSVSYLQSLSADILTPVVPTLNQLVMPTSFVSVSSRFVAGNFTENCGYLGIGFIMWVAYVATRFRANRVVLFCAYASLGAFVLSLGPRLVIDAHVTSIPLPEALLYRLPLMNHVVPSRFAVVVILFAVIAAGVGAEQFILRSVQRGSRSRRFESIFVGVVGVLTLTLMIPQIALVTRPPNWPSDSVQALGAIPHGAVTLSYPYPQGINTEAMSWQAQRDFAFRLIGGYINIPGPDGHGQAYAYPLRPPTVQSFLVDSLGGVPNPYGLPPNHLQIRQDLCSFVRRYHVGALIYWRTGVHPERVRQLFTHDFGRPTASVSHGAFEVWRITPGACAGG